MERIDFTIHTTTIHAIKQLILLIFAIASFPLCNENP